MKRTRLSLTLSVAALCAVSFAWADLANADSCLQSAGDSSQEEPTSTVADLVERLGPESKGRIPVAVRMHAQMYYLYRADPGFEESLRLLRNAQARKLALRITFRRYSGRIIAVAPPN